MAGVRKALNTLGKILKKQELTHPISLETFLQSINDNPELVLRDVFQIFYDMMHHYIPEGVNEYPNDPETINYIKYDMNNLLAEDADTPYFADRLFANRLFNKINSFKQGVQQNRIFVFEGPPGSGKSTFLKNLLNKFEKYTALDQGAAYETIWRINVAKLGGMPPVAAPVVIEGATATGDTTNTVELSTIFPGDHFLVPCPSHDHPILQIPKQHRLDFLKDIIQDPKLFNHLQSSKEFEWVFKAEPCTICKSIYNTLMNRLGSPDEVLKMLHARRFIYDRQLGEGISVFNPGDEVIKKPITNAVLQNMLNNLFRDSNAVRYIYSRLAKTNNGVFAVMDVKNHNRDRILNLHGIISDQIHKVEYIEERIRSLFIAIINPEDQSTITDVKSFQDRIVRIRMPYVLDYKTEFEIYRHMVGSNIKGQFLPRVLESFAKVIISTRLKPESAAMKGWISDSKKYERWCDKNLLLLKMDIYAGYIPSWVDEEDLKVFSAKKRRRIIGEGEIEGDHGISGRQSIEMFVNFVSRYTRGNVIITMDNLLSYFRQLPKETKAMMPPGFLDALKNLYDFDVLQEVKEALYAYNQEQMTQDIMNYLSAISYDVGTTIKSIYTGEVIEVSDTFFSVLEGRLLGPESSEAERREFRETVQKQYVSTTLTREMGTGNKKLNETTLFENLQGKYANRLKQNVMDPLVNNDSFRMAIKDFGKKEYDTYDNRIKKDVGLLFKNLQDKFFYTESGAQKVCIYVLDNDLVNKFNGSK